MLIDARTVGADGPHALEAEVCVVGGGIAGLTIALELARSGIDVVVLESGGLASDARTDDLHVGESVGQDYRFDAFHRSRYLGGGSNCWGGWCRPLEPEDFRPRAWVGGSGWPLDREDLLPYYDRAHAVLGLGPTTYETEYWSARTDRRRDHVPELDESVVHSSFSQFATGTHFGRRQGDELRRQPHLTVLLHTTLTQLQTGDRGDHVVAATARTLTGRQVDVRARRFVLATGGVENARLLLAAGGRLATDHDLVGRWFMEHPRRLCGEVRFLPGLGRSRVYDVRRRSRAITAGGVAVSAAFALTPQVQEREKVLNARAAFRSIYVGDRSTSAEALRRLNHLVQHRDGWGREHAAELARVARHPGAAAGFAAGRWMGGGPLVRSTQLEMIVEPDPDRDSRVTLSDEVDALGVPRARIDWRVGDQVGHTFQRTTEILAEELSRAGVAVVTPVPVSPSWRDDVVGTWHHMGTTRMDPSPRAGVVDTDARVHGVDNLYVSGSSVFPTAGVNFPTLTLTALALRLADHLAQVSPGRPA